MIAPLVLAFAMTLQATHELRYLALGDSYTIGEAVEEAGRWPMQLAKGLRERDGIPLADPHIVATTGWTTDELSQAMDLQLSALDSASWDFVTLLIGVNNQYRGRPVDEFGREFDALLQRAIALAGTRKDRVLVLTIPDWGVTPFGARSGRDLERVARELDAYNAKVAEVCAARGVTVVDIAPISRERGAQLVAEDGLHPSAQLYSEWTAVARPIAAALLRDQRSR
jgi:lysophospholipase L1-like esterase